MSYVTINNELRGNLTTVLISSGSLPAVIISVDEPDKYDSFYGRLGPGSVGWVGKPDRSLNCLTAGLHPLTASPTLDHVT